MLAGGSFRIEGRSGWGNRYCATDGIGVVQGATREKTVSHPRRKDSEVRRRPISPVTTCFFLSTREGL